MNIQYLDDQGSNIFEIIACKQNDRIECHTILLSPICRFIDSLDSSNHLISAISEYLNLINEMNIKESPNSELFSECNYFAFGVSEGEGDSLNFIYSEEFELDSESMKTVQSKSIELAEIILSILANEEDTIQKYLEEELTELISFNYIPIEDGVAEVLGVVLEKTKENNFGISISSYSENIDSSLINDMFSKLMPIIEPKLRNYNFFLVTEPVVLIKLGVSTAGEYMIDTNNILMDSLNELELPQVKSLLVETFEKL